MAIKYKELYLDHHNCTLESNYTGHYEFEMSTEYTADDYNIYLCKYPGEHTIISEHIHYYAHDLEDVLKEKIKECDKVFCDEAIEDELYIEWEQMCEEDGLIEWNDDEEKYEVVGEDDE